MGSPVPVVLTFPVFREGWPAYPMGGPMSYYIFDVKLADGTVTQAIVDFESKDGMVRQLWRRPFEHQQELTDVVGWRSDITCADVAEVMWLYVSKPQGVVAKVEWANALNRHIRSDKDEQGASVVTCETCARLFVQAWRERHNAVPEGWEKFAG